MWIINPDVFPVEPLPTGNLASSSGQEAFDEANAFLGRKWTDIDRNFAHRYRDAIFWFRPDAFYYYLPAFLVAGVNGKGTDELFIGSIVQLLRKDPNLEFTAFRKERWKRLTEKQADALLHCLYWLRKRMSDNDVRIDDVEDAINTVKSRDWNNWEALKKGSDV